MSARHLLSTLLLAGLLAPAARAEDPPLLVRGRVHTGEGDALPDGGVLIEGGKITRVAAWDALGALPEGTRTVELGGAEITAGLIDAAAQELTGDEEQAREVVPELRAVDGVDLSAPEWSHLARQGVTTVFAVGDNSPVIGPQGALLKTAGPAGQRVLDPAGAIRIVLGREAWIARNGRRNHGPWGGADLSTRRPTTRMGLVWVVREAFSAARTAEPGSSPASDALRAVLDGKAPLRMHARQRNDLETALRLQEELGLPELLLEECTEAWRLADLLARRKVRVIYGPIFEQPRGMRARTGEAEEPCLRGAAILAEAGVELCLTAAERRDEDGLPAQAMLAIRYGLPFEKALAAVTSAPARLLGVGQRLGSLAPGKDADLVVWSGRPFEATTRPLLVLIDGQPVRGELPRPAAPRERF